MISIRPIEVAGGVTHPPVPAGGWARTLAGTLLALCTLLGVALAGGEPVDAADGIDEYTAKAHCLSWFAKFVTWPAERLGEKAPLVLGVFGQDPFGQRLEEAFGKRKEEERKVTIRRLTKIEELREVHVLFVPAREVGRMKEIMAALSEASVLVVGETTDFALRGGSINFYVEAKKLGFEINPEEVKRQKLKISSELLRLGRIVKEKDSAKQ